VRSRSDCAPAPDHGAGARRPSQQEHCRRPRHQPAHCREPSRRCHEENRLALAVGADPISARRRPKHRVAISRLTESASAAGREDPVGEFAAEFEAPLPDRLVPHRDAAGGQHLLNHAQAQREPKIQPYRVADDLSGVATAGVNRASRRRHPARLPDQPDSYQACSRLADDFRPI
jgi:hypothetical protein